jgi:hypothetical protein
MDQIKVPDNKQKRLIPLHSSHRHMQHRWSIFARTGKSLHQEAYTKKRLLHLFIPAEQSVPLVKQIYSINSEKETKLYLIICVAQTMNISITIVKT